MQIYELQDASITTEVADGNVLKMRVKSASHEGEIDLTRIPPDLPMAINMPVKGGMLFLFVGGTGVTADVMRGSTVAASSLLLDNPLANFSWSVLVVRDSIFRRVDRVLFKSGENVLTEEPVISRPARQYSLWPFRKRRADHRHALYR
ncbi:hypothetical protein ACQP2F_13670 [Actinoplanes sp. CA-030573]|uniref:hypothetical protein n=1 Tax=Actinoplanes sp. CA-030573 TaxID=3239898 RepID=UPI003D8A5E64